ncbi:MAG: hypothetical protein KF703_10955, partial [Actinobacteria bacterium]|nr:hypothetical protein [Actinomycetota bacterium]
QLGRNERERAEQSASGPLEGVVPPPPVDIPTAPPPPNPMEPPLSAQAPLPPDPYPDAPPPPPR